MARSGSQGGVLHRKILSGVTERCRTSQNEDPHKLTDSNLCMFRVKGDMCLSHPIGVLEVYNQVRNERMSEWMNDQ